MRKRALFVLVISLSASIPVFGQGLNYRDTELHYSLSIPEQWQQIPDEVVEQTMTETAKAAKMPVQKYEAGFQSSSSTWFSYPYVLIQHHPVNGATFGQLSRLMEDLGTSEEELVPEDQDVISAAGIGQPVTDRVRGIITVPLKMNVAEVGPVRGLMILKPGKLAIVQVDFYAPEAEFEVHGAALDVFLDSLRFDEGYEYTTVGALTRGLDLGRILEKGVVGAVLGLLLGLIGLAIRRRKTPA